MHSTSLRFGGSAFLLALSPVCLAQSTWHVDASAVPPGNGSAAQPYVDLQFALAHAATVSGDTLLVEPGTYVGPFDYLGKDVVVRSTQGAAVTILDGNDQLVSVVSFVNGEGPGAVLDGFTVTRGRGSVSVFPPIFVFPNGVQREGGGIRCANSSPVLTNLRVVGNRGARGAGVLLLNSAAVLSHSTIESNWDAYPYTAGTGVYSNLQTATIDTCTIESNPPANHVTHEGFGGGFFGRALVRDTAFRNNRAMAGSGAFVYGATFERCTFEHNVGYADCVQAITDGGAISHASSSNSGGSATVLSGLVEGPTLVDTCVFVDNTAHRGGAISCKDGSTVIVTDSQFAGNSAVGMTGCDATQVFAEGGAARHAQLFDCDVSGNWAAKAGGGLAYGSATRTAIHGNYVSAVTPATPRGGGGAFAVALVDCDVFDNSTLEGCCPTYGPVVGGGSFQGSALRTRYSRNVSTVGGGAAGGTLTNCTFFENVATLDGGSMAATKQHIGTSHLVASNVIARAGTPNEVAVLAPATATVTYSDVQGGYAGSGNLDLDPRFFAPHAGDFHLKPGSPCIDAGDPSSPLDADGSIADVGAYPFDPNYCSSPGVWCAGKPNSLGCVPAMSSSGTPSATGADDFFVTGSNFLGQTFGLLAWSRTPNSIPFQNGTLCLSGPFFRAGMQVASGTGGACDGTYAFHFSQSYRASFGINTYETIYAQWFARDSAHPDGTGWSLSNALEFTVCP